MMYSATWTCVRWERAFAASYRGYLELHAQACAEDILLIEFSGEEDSVLDLFIAEFQRNLIGDIIGCPKLHAALIVGSDLAQFVAHFLRLVGGQVIGHELISEPNPQLLDWLADKPYPGSIAVEIEGATV